mmetsp:Transcript_91886/g.239684  ORF Transcript_91886/g.239684 Transcript_91886/m.239684 type:complete len:82 (-) Transcript_91886:738-983(-)
MVLRTRKKGSKSLLAKIMIRSLLNRVYSVSKRNPPVKIQWLTIFLAHSFAAMPTGLCEKRAVNLDVQPQLLAEPVQDEKEE